MTIQTSTIADFYIVDKGLYIRPIQRSDARSIQKAASDRLISDTMISVPHPYPDGGAERYIRRCEAGIASGDIFPFVIERIETNQFLGLIEIRDIERENFQAELSFWVARESWSTGIMSAALKPIIQYGFLDLNLNRIFAYHMLRNQACGRVLEKNGLTREGVLRQRIKKWGVFEDVVVRAVLRSEWSGE